jgi:hypothetical protein
MDELLARIEARVGVTADVARKAIGVIVTHLDEHAPAERMTELFAAIPGAADLVGQKKKTGLIGKMLGGGLIGVYNDLRATGMDTGQMQGAGEELMDFARERAGAETVDEILASVPGLKQFL